MNWYKLASEDDLINIIDSKELDKWHKVNSSFIDSITYYQSAKVLEVKFKNGKIYPFMDIPESIFEQFLDSESKGKFFNNVILRNYSVR